MNPLTRVEMRPRHTVKVLGAGAVNDRLRQAVTRLRQAEQFHAHVRTLNRLADEVLAAKAARFDAAIQRGWLPTIEQQAQHRRDELLIDEPADSDV